MKIELANGLILRSLSAGISSDYDNLAQFYVDVFEDEGDEDLDEIRDWTEDLISDTHPTMSLDDVWVVIDPTQEERIVSALLLIPQVWRYGDIEIPVGRIELVATHKDYRRCGLVRALMTIAHERSKALGHMMQVITGIPHYYRRFGYGMAIPLGADAQLPISSISKLNADQHPQYTFRKASSADIPKIQKWEAYEQRSCGLTVKHDADYWDYDMNGRRSQSPMTLHMYIVVDADRGDLGYITFFMTKHFRYIHIWQFAIGEQASYYAVFDDVLRAIKTCADEFYAPLPDEKYPIQMKFDNGLNPALKALVRNTNGGIIHKNVYTWYIRVADIPAFIKHIAPVLEKRLQGSGVNRFSGELKIGFYELNGIKLTFEDGKVIDVVDSEMKQYEADTAMPYDTFLNILFGHREWRELAYILPEIYANRKADMLLAVLFPKMRAELIGIG